jgi:hypothetical protein
MAVLPTGIGPVTNGGYQIERSLRFNSADSAYLSRTFTTPTNAKKFTISAWVKITSPSGSLLDFSLLSGANSSEIIGVSGVGAFGASVNNRLIVRFGDSNLVYYPQLFRDVSAWAHIVVAIDTDQATQSDRAKFYYNGVLQTATSSTITSGYSPALNTAATRYIGGLSTNAGYYANGYLTEYNFIDGQALTPSDFGETDSATGVWKPKAYTGTYGTNGFYLKFADNSGTTSTTLGKDSSGNGNNWTPNNFSVTAGAGNDSMVDSPTAYGTDTGIGGEVRGNYCTFNPIAPSTVVNGTVTKSDGNLVSTDGGTTYGLASFGTIAVSSGKWYWEVTMTSAGSVYSNIGIVDVSQPLYAGDHTGYCYTGSGGKAGPSNPFVSAGGSAYGSSYTTGDIIGIALDMDAKTVTFYKNNVSQGVAFTGLTGVYTPGVGDGQNATSYTFTLNTGQRAFAYTAPSGFKALCTTNLSTPTIGATSTTQANDYFDVVTWTDNATGDKTITPSCTPDMVWSKSRSNTPDHAISDRVRGNFQLFPNQTYAEDTTQRVTFNTDSITFKDGYGVVNETGASGYTYVDWVWKANGAGSSNTAGTITSTVSANTTSGFSIVTYTGNGTNGATVGHGCQVGGVATAPSMIIVKKRSTGTAGNWIVYHTSTGINQYLYLNSTAAAATSSPTWGVSSTLITLQQPFNDYNTSTAPYVAYCFAAVAGYSAFGSYTGNGSADGPFVYTGFRPRFVMIKSTTLAEGWNILDTARDVSNPELNLLFPSSSSAEFNNGSTWLDGVSNGFKIRYNQSPFNTSGATYIYMAFAESPFKYALAR